MIASLYHWHENERLVKLAQTPGGRILLWLAALILLDWLGSNLLVAIALSLVMVSPGHKRIMLSIGSVGVVVDGLLKRQGLSLDLEFLSTGISNVSAWTPLLVQSLAVIGMLYLAFRVTLQFDRWPALARRNPVLAVHCGVWLALMLSQVPPFAVLLQVAFLAWRLSYMVKFASRGLAGETRFTDHFFYLMPVFGGNATPFGKGLDFLSRHEAGTKETFARSQLAGLKLLMLAILWTVLLNLLDALFFGWSTGMFSNLASAWSPDLPTLKSALSAGMGGRGWYLGWVILMLELIRDVLRLAAMGHLIVGCLRLFGFNVFRNTYKPLLSESIVDFWSRFYYYFKELLVDFFFYPTFLRLGSVNPRLRLFFAVFAAAFLGNMYYHLLYNPENVIQGEFELLWATWGTRLVYCFLLAFGIWISMLRQQEQRRGERAVGAVFRLRRIAGVWLFFGVIQIWNQKTTESGMLDAFRFFFSLFGI